MFDRLRRKSRSPYIHYIDIKDRLWYDKEKKLVVPGSYIIYDKGEHIEGKHYNEAILISITTVHQMAQERNIDFVTELEEVIVHELTHHFVPDWTHENKLAF